MNAATPRIRPETAADAPVIHAVTTAAFRDTPRSDQREAAIVDALRRAGALSVSLVAECDGEVAGHVAASPVTIDGRDGDWFGLGPISVLPAWQRRGIGGLLVQASLRQLRALGAGGCVVLGDPAYYGRFGFRATPDLRLPGVPPGYFQRLHLSGSPATGTVAYHAGFHA